MLRLDWIRQHEGVLLAGGGHAMAGGVTIAFESLERFTLLFEQSTRQALAGTTLLSVLEHDGSIGCEGLTPSLLDEVASLEPYGQGFARPVILIEHALVESAHSIGKDGVHLKLNEWPVVPGERRSFAIEPQANWYRGVARVQAKVVGMVRG